MIRRSLQKHHDVQLTPNLSMDSTIMKLTAALLLLSAHLSLGLSTYFLHWLTLLRVCSASSLDGSMMRALGVLELDLTWLTLALPEDKYTWQTECKETLIQALQAVKNECGLKLTCLAGFDHMTVWSLVQGHISIFRLVFERFITEVEFQFSILGLIDITCILRKAVLKEKCYVATTSCVYVRYLQHTGSKERLVFHLWRDLKSQTQIITCETQTGISYSGFHLH